MAINFSVSVKNARLESLTNEIDASPSKLVLYDVSEQVVCELTFPAISKYTIADGVLILKDIPEGIVLITTDVTHAKVAHTDETFIMDCSVGVVGSSSDLELPTTALFQGSFLRLSGWTISEL